MSTEWNINERDFPAGGTPSGRLQFALRYATLAPSNRNSQPWRFVQSGHGVALLAGGFFSNIGLALADFAALNGKEAPQRAPAARKSAKKTG